jgi:hypothetical protein
MPSVFYFMLSHLFMLILCLEFQLRALMANHFIFYHLQFQEAMCEEEQLF